MNIVILSRNKNLYSTRRLIEEAENRGHDVEVIDPLSCDLIIEKEKPTVYYKGKYLDYVDAIIPRIGATKGCFLKETCPRSFQILLGRTSFFITANSTTSFPGQGLESNIMPTIRLIRTPTTMALRCCFFSMIWMRAMAAPDWFRVRTAKDIPISTMASS